MSIDRALGRVQRTLQGALSASCREVRPSYIVIQQGSANYTALDQVGRNGTADRMARNGAEWHTYVRT